MELVNITAWASSEVRTVEISLSLLHAPYKVKVRRFIPEPGDMMAEQWTRDGELVQYPLPPYGFADMEEAAASIGRMIERNAGSYIAATVGGNSVGQDGLISETYLAAFRRASRAPVSISSKTQWDTPVNSHVDDTGAASPL